MKSSLTEGSPCPSLFYPSLSFCLFFFFRPTARGAGVVGLAKASFSFLSGLRWFVISSHNSFRWFVISFVCFLLIEQLTCSTSFCPPLLVSLSNNIIMNNNHSGFVGGKPCNLNNGYSAEGGAVGGGCSGWG